MGGTIARNSLEMRTVQMHASSENIITRDEAPSQTEEDTYQQQQSSTRLIPLLVSVFMTMFLVALDRTIISTAIPQITNDFNSLPDVGWYGSAYLLTCSSFQLLFGKFYTFWAVKTVLLSSVLLFEVGSIVCGAAPSSVAFIVGRAISGMGAAGVFSGTIACIVHAVPLKNRPRLQGLFGAIFGVASVVGPLIGGVFTSKVTWRWCFYINAPIGGVAMVIIALCLEVPDQDTTKVALTKKLSQLDVIGNTFLMPGVVCLLLALQWGGQIYAWNSGRVIALLAIASVFLVAFVVVQILLPKTATVPPHIAKQRSIIAGFLATIFLGSSQYIFVYFLPIWFQAINGASAVDSGIRLLPLMMAMVLASISGGIIVQKTGHYTPTAIVGSSIMSIGAGLLITLQVDTENGKWIGYQILYGFGMGLCSQGPNIAAQTVLPTEDVSIGIALMFFATLLGAAVFVSVGQNVLDNQLVHRLSGLPGFEPSLITEGGATSFLNSLPASLRQASLIDYNEALRNVFQIGLIMSCLATLSFAMLEWKSVKKAEADKGAQSNFVVAE